MLVHVRTTVKHVAVKNLECGKGDTRRTRFTYHQTDPLGQAREPHQEPHYPPGHEASNSRAKMRKGTKKDPGNGVVRPGRRQRTTRPVSFGARGQMGP